MLAWWGLRRTLANRTVGELAGAPTRGAAWPSANLQAWTGLVLIAAGLALISKQSAFPGWWALLPVCGTVLLIAAGPAAWVNRVLLSSRLMVGAGLISYPLYLWHWPMLSFANILMLGQVPSWLRAGLVLASVLLAWATYRWVELPVRFSTTGVVARMRIPALAAAMLLLAVIAYASYKLPAFPQGPVAREARFLNDYSIDYFRQQSVEDLFADQRCARSIARFEQDGAGDDEGRDCRSQYPGRPTVMLVGDSHAIFLQLGLMPYLSARQINFAAFSSSTCVPFAAENAMARLEQQLKCRKVNADLEEKVRTMKPELLIIFAHYLGRGQSADGGAYEYSGYLDALRSGLATSTGTRDILVLGQMPTWNGGLPKALARNFRNTGLVIPPRTTVGVAADSLTLDGVMRASLTRLAGRIPSPGQARIRYVSLRESLCNMQGCLTSVGENLREDLVVWDYGHLTVSGAKWVTDTVLAPLMAPVVPLVMEVGAPGVTAVEANRTGRKSLRLSPSSGG